MEQLNILMTYTDSTGYTPGYHGYHIVQQMILFIWHHI